MLTKIALSFVNHLLAGESWARIRLQSFVGQNVRLELGSIIITVNVSVTGLLNLVGQDTVTSVVVTLPANALLGAAVDRSLFSSAQITGSAEFAEALAFIFRNLRWDAESDLSKVIGDIAARRLATGGKLLLHLHLERARRVAINATEYLIAESPGMATPTDIAEFGKLVKVARDDCNRCEQRLLLLENH